MLFNWWLAIRNGYDHHVFDSSGRLVKYHQRNESSFVFHLYWLGNNKQIHLCTVVEVANKVDAHIPI